MAQSDQFEWDFYDLGCDLNPGDGARYPPSPGGGVRYGLSPRHTRRLSQWLAGDEDFSSRSASSHGWSLGSSQDGHTYTRHNPTTWAETQVLPRDGTKDSRRSFPLRGKDDLSVRERLPSRGSTQTAGEKQKEGTAKLTRTGQTKPAKTTLLEEDGCTALHRAVVGGHVEVVQALIEEGASVDRQDQHGNTPLHEAAWNGYSRTVELLIKARANIHAKNENGFTPLHLAVQNGHSQSCRMLLMGGCMPDAKNNYGDTALHLATKYGHVTGTRILLSARCHVNQRNKDGRTPLHIAANLGLRKLTKILIEASADVNAKDKDGKTPIDLARDKENPECILIMTSTPKGKRSGRGRSTHRKDNSNIRRSHSLPADGTNNKGKEQAPQQRKDKPVKRVQIQTGQDKTTRKQTPSIQVKSAAHPVRYRESQDRLRHRHHHHQHHHHQHQQQSTSAVKAGRSSQHPAQIPPHLLPQAFPQMYHMVRDQKGNLQKIPVYQCYGCTPYLQQMENKLEAHREELLAEIDDSHWALNSQMQQVERKCSHHAACLDQLCRERVSAEQTACLHRIDKRATQDRRELQADTDAKVKSVRHSLQAWMEQKYSDLQNRLERATLSDRGVSSDVYRESQATTDRTWLDTSTYPLEKAQSEGVLDRRYTSPHGADPPTEHNHLHPTDDEKLGTVMWVSSSTSNVFPRDHAGGHTAWAASRTDGVSRSGDTLSTRHHGHPSTVRGGQISADQAKRTAHPSTDQ
ncbi:ankyrin repeat domain-containing protein 6-like [Branchiostoma floridae]|uniref:Ankyrin repeat domain-containing protein 6-like n=1 Tax=Branchiostoma floridae TaxID=7739 RepID=A0A9J7N1G3_BRAFL|nr:ankyrin repeat domain-containing protein 6-like [Branchiostoma floridae]